MQLTEEEKRQLEMIVRQSVPNARDKESNMDMKLADFDIDSMGMVSFMFDIEQWRSDKLKAFSGARKMMPLPGHRGGVDRAVGVVSNGA